jgi:thioredoxin-dependent peroxiredoxin
MAYQTENWTINIKPVFMKELKALFGTMFPGNKSYLKLRNFYRFYLTVYLALFVTYYTINTNNTQNMNKIEVGSSIPTFELLDQDGNNFRIADVIGKKNLVIFFYPKDDSPGCTKEACSFRDQFAVFEDADALVIGISGQSVESHKKFAEKHRLKYTLLSDKGNKIRKEFGVPTNLFGLLPGRVTYIINKAGKVEYVFSSQMEATKHVDESVRILKTLK